MSLFLWMSHIPWMFVQINLWNFPENIIFFFLSYIFDFNLKLILTQICWGMFVFQQVLIEKEIRNIREKLDV